MNKERLLKLADFLDTLPAEKFDYGTLAFEGGKPMLEALAAGSHPCGTVACALGWTPAVFPEIVRWTQNPLSRIRRIMILDETPNSRNCYEVGARLFDISGRSSHDLFDPVSSGLGENATAKQVADHIRRFVQEGEDLD